MDINFQGGFNMSDEIDKINMPIDTEIELEVFRLQCKENKLKIWLKYIIMFLALIGASVLGGIYDGDFLAYAFIFYGIVISFAIGQKVDMGSISDIIKK